MVHVQGVMSARRRKQPVDQSKVSVLFSFFCDRPSSWPESQCAPLSLSVSTSSDLPKEPGESQRQPSRLCALSGGSGAAGPGPRGEERTSDGRRGRAMKSKTRGRMDRKDDEAWRGGE